MVERGDLSSNVTAARVSAVNALSVRLWQHLEIWQTIEAQASSYTHMSVWDHCGGEISFDAPPKINAVLGYIIHNADLQRALLTKVQASSQIRVLSQQTCVELSQDDNGVRLVLSDAIIHAHYIVGCDGVESWVRQQTNIPMTMWPYENTAIVANVVTEKSHYQTAYQKFTAEGPLAFLPLLNPHEVSIVWSVPPDRAQVLLSLSDDDFLKELTFTSESRLGSVTHTSKRFALPLKMQHIQRYFQQRIILCADAAHVVHPLAGQGLNLAMQDVIALSDVLIFAPDKAHIPRYLRQYERARKAENWQMILGLEAIKRLYGVQEPVIQGVIQQGVQGLAKANSLKKLMLKIASGEYINMPPWLDQNK
jgi:2-octaprenylphenol hydroxylase